MSLIKILELIGSAIGTIGGFLGILSWNQTRKIQKFTVADFERKEREREEEQRMSLEIVRAGIHKVWRFKVGESEFTIAERLVEKGKLNRHAPGTYTIKTL